MTGGGAAEIKAEWRRRSQAGSCNACRRGVPPTTEGGEDYWVLEVSARGAGLRFCSGCVDELSRVLHAAGWRE